MSKDPTYPLFPILAFLGFVLSLIPFPWHLQAWNSGTCAFMFWTALACIIGFVNSLVWQNSISNVAPIWCDIVTQLMLASGVGLPAAILCISRRLYKITSVHSVSNSREDKRRAICIDMAIALGIPILVLILHTVVQPRRFDIFEGVGCAPVTYHTLAAYFLFFMWPILLGLVALGFSAMTLRSFYIRRLQFNQLAGVNSALNPGRYFRLIILAITNIFCTIPLGVWTIFNFSNGDRLEHWTSWDDAHVDFERVILHPALLWRNSSLHITVEANRWLPVAYAFVFFAIFGFGEEAMKNYRRAFWFLAKPFGFSPAKKLSIPPFKPELPKYRTDDMTRKGDVELGLNARDFSSAPPAYTRTVQGSQSETSVSETLAPSSSSFRDSCSMFPHMSYSERLQMLSMHHNRPYTPNTFSTYSYGSSLSIVSCDEDSDSNRISISDVYPASQPPSRLPSIIIIGRPDAEIDTDDSDTQSMHSQSSTYTSAPSSFTSVYHSTPDLTTTARAPTPMPALSSMNRSGSYSRPFANSTVHLHAGHVGSGPGANGQVKGGIQIMMETHTETTTS